MDGRDLESGAGGSASHGQTRSLLPVLPLSLLSHAKVGDIPRVRLLIIGDSGVGKSMLAGRLAGDTVQEMKDNPYSSYNTGTTTGAQTECRLYEYRHAPTSASAAAAMSSASNTHHPSLSHRSTGMGYSSGASASASSSSSLFFIDFFDVSGHRKYALSRDLFYSGLHGVIIVWDLMNRKSYENIVKWLKEIAKAEKEKGGIEESWAYEGAGGGASGTTTTHTKMHTSNGGSGGAGALHMRTHSRGNSAANSPHQSPALRPTVAPGSGNAFAASTLAGVSPPPVHALASAAPTASPPAASMASASPSSAFASSLLASFNGLPILLVGNKLDEYRSHQHAQGQYDTQRDFGGLESIYVSAMAGGPGGADDSAGDKDGGLGKFDAFYDRVIARRFFRDHYSAGGGGGGDGLLGRQLNAYASYSPFHSGLVAPSSTSFGPAHTSAHPSAHLYDLGQVGAGLSSRRMAPYHPGSQNKQHQHQQAHQARPMDAWATSSGSGPLAHPASQPSARGEYTPPPIRTLSDFSIDVPSVPSPSDPQSPTVLSPSDSASDGRIDSQSYQRFEYGKARPSQQQPPQPPPGPLLFAMQQAGQHQPGMTSLPANTALHALTQQSRFNRDR